MMCQLKPSRKAKQLPARYERRAPLFSNEENTPHEENGFVGTFPVAADDRLGRDGVLPKPPSGATGKRLFTLANLVTRRIPLVFANPAS